MSQTPIPFGLNSSGAMFVTNDMVTAEELSAAINEAIKLLNGSLTDVNVRTVGGGYSGIPEADVTFASTNGPGHTHDGVDSCLLAPNSIRRPEIGDEEQFLLSSWTTVVPATRQVILGGKVALRLDTIHHASHNPTVRFHVITPLNTDEISLSSGSLGRVIATPWFVQLNPDKGVDRIQGSIFVEAVDVVDSVLLLNFQYNLSPQDKGGFESDDCWLGVQWFCAAQATFSSPVV